MALRVEYTRGGRRALKKVPRGPAKALAGAIKALARDPYALGSKQLGGPLREYHRITVDDYRAIYFVEGDTVVVVVVVVGHRRDVYLVAKRRL